MGPPRLWRLIDLSIPQQTDRQTDREKVSPKVSHHPLHFYKALQVSAHVMQRLAPSPQSTPGSGFWAEGLLVFPCSPAVSPFLQVLQVTDTRGWWDSNSEWTACVLWWTANPSRGGPAWPHLKLFWQILQAPEVTWSTLWWSNCDLALTFEQLFREGLCKVG